MRPEAAQPMRVMLVYSTIITTYPKPGVTVYDLGQNFAGRPAISVSGPTGAAVKLIPGELLDAQGLVTQRSSGSPEWYSYTLRGEGVETWHPRFSYYGFRYVQVEGAASGAEKNGAHLLLLRGEAVHSSSTQTGNFASSDELLNRIHGLILRAIENNSMSLFTDCPHREKLGWLEESHLMASALLYDFDFSGLFAATARNIADTQRTTGQESGMVPAIAPQYVIFDPKTAAVYNDSPEWGAAAVLNPWYVYERMGMRTFLEEQYPVMRAYADYLSTRADDGIIDYGLGDWYDIGPGGPGFSQLTTAGVTATAIYYQDLKTLEQAAAVLGKPEQSLAYAQRAEAIRTAFNRRFFDAAKHLYDKGSQTALAMPLVVGLVPEGERATVLSALVDDIRAHQNHVTAGDVGFHYVVDALMLNGRSDVLYDMLERTDSPGYGYQLAQGATALTEAWDTDRRSSQDHLMLGHAEEWFYRGLGGIDLDLARAGAARLSLHPVMVGKLAWVRTSYASTLGLIQSNWQRSGSTVLYDFTVPPNATATIEIAAASQQAITVNQTAAAQAVGVATVSAKDGKVTLVVSSGTYRIRSAGRMK